jgi:hypothetical protein
MPSNELCSVLLMMTTTTIGQGGASLNQLLSIPALRAGDTLVFTVVAAHNHITGRSAAEFLGQTQYRIPEWTKTDPYWRKRLCIRQELRDLKVPVVDGNFKTKEFARDDFVAGDGHILFKFRAAPVNATHFVKGMRVSDKAFSTGPQVSSLAMRFLALDGNDLHFYSAENSVKPAESFRLSECSVETSQGNKQMQCGDFACFDLNRKGKFAYRIICPSVVKGSAELSGFFKLQEKLQNRLESERVKREYAKEHGM